MSSLYRNNNSSMFTAIKKKDVARVLQMISLPGYDINYVTKKKITPLILAAKFGKHTIYANFHTTKTKTSWFLT